MIRLTREHLSLYNGTLFFLSFGITIASFLFFVLFPITSFYDPYVAISFEYSERLVTVDELYLEASNEYGSYDGSYPYLTEDELVEPFKNTTLALFGSLVDSGNYSFQWSIDSLTEGTMGVKIKLVFDTTGVFPTTVVVSDALGNYFATLRLDIISKYVKREIRSLTPEDRTRFLNAAHTLWEYSTEEGRKVFGDDFTSIQTFVEVHSQASNDMLCDSFHGGTGFLTRHLALTNSFEAALRAVDPAVTLPYWDFTIEGEEIYELNKNPSYLMEITPVFSAEWFGSVDIDHHIADGRWAHSAMPMAQDENVTQNSYGYIRSYWNNNPDSEVTRYPFYICGEESTRKKIPNCNSHFEVLDSPDLATLLLLAQGDGHGPMHVHIGGVYGGCVDGVGEFSDKWGEWLDQNMTEEDASAAGYDDPYEFLNKWGYTQQRREMFENAVMGEYYHLYRMLWRSHLCAADQTPGLLECPDYCDPLDTPFSNCTCAVNKLFTGETTWQNVFPCIIGSGNQPTFNATWPQEMLEDMVKLVATSSVLEGEMIESASTADIIFWLVHPVIERLLSAKRLEGVSAMAGNEFVKWPVVDGSNETWLTYSYYDLAEGENSFHPEAYTCAGNAPDDFVIASLLPYTAAISKSADKDGDGFITNWDFFVALDPNDRDANDYVFDHFNWDHCTNLRPDADTDTNADTDTDADAGADTDPGTNAHADADAYSDAEISSPTPTQMSLDHISSTTVPDDSNDDQASRDKDENDTELSGVFAASQTSSQTSVPTTGSTFDDETLNNEQAIVAEQKAEANSWW